MNSSIRVLFMGVIASVTGQKEMALPVEPGATLRSVLNGLEARYGPDFGRRLFRAQQEPRPLQMHTRIFLNGTLVGDDALDQPLAAAGGEAESAEILIYLLPAATGG